MTRHGSSPTSPIPQWAAPDPRKISIAPRLQMPPLAKRGGASSSGGCLLRLLFDDFKGDALHGLAVDRRIEAIATNCGKLGSRIDRNEDRLTCAGADAWGATLLEFAG